MKAKVIQTDSVSQIYPKFGLGMRNASAGTLQGKEGDVVLLIPALPHEGVKLLQERVYQRSFLAVLRDERTQPRASTRPSL